MFYIPEGFAHGFLVLSDMAEFVYKCTDIYDPSSEGGIPWDDPTIHVEWPQLDVPYKTLSLMFLTRPVQKTSCMNPSGTRSLNTLENTDYLQVLR